MRVLCISISKDFTAICSLGHPGPRFPPPLGSFQWVFFSLFPSVGASQAREFQIATATTPRTTVQTTYCAVIYIFSPTKYPKPRVFFMCLRVFAMFFFSQHSNLHICRHKTVPKQHVLQYFQFSYFPKPLKIPLFTMFSSIFPCSNAAGQLKHIYKMFFL